MQYNSLREKIRAEKEERMKRYEAFTSLWSRAVEAGCYAAEAHTPTPMTVCDSRSGQEWTVPEGPCGFASIIVRPANSSFAHWCRKNLNTYKHYYGGLNIPVRGYGQSYELKSAFARAACQVLKAEGINAYVDARLD